MQLQLLLFFVLCLSFCTRLWAVELPSNAYLPPADTATDLPSDLAADLATDHRQLDLESLFVPHELPLQQEYALDLPLVTHLIAWKSARRQDTLY
ncbi:hypothetical protein ACLKA7_005975 [Drosophila subpalustris]